MSVARLAAACYTGSTIMIEIVVATFGLCVGSFLNVCIHRMPLHESVVTPRSRCPGCRKTIAWYDNLPVLSFLILRAQCRACGQPISWRYPAVELLTGAAWLAAFLKFGLTPELALYGAFLSALIVVTFIDIDHMIIPDAITLPGIPIGFAAAVLGVGPDVRDSAIGILLGGGLLYAVAAGYQMVTGREGLGGGDIKLLGLVGAVLGARGALVTLLLGSLTGSVFGVLLILLQRNDSKTPFPFGPFLAAAAAIGLFFGDALLDWYLSMLIQ